MEQSHFYLGALRNNTDRIPLEYRGEQEVGAESEAGGGEGSGRYYGGNPLDASDTGEVFPAPDNRGQRVLSGRGTKLRDYLGKALMEILSGYWMKTAPQQMGWWERGQDEHITHGAFTSS